jgi:hypothetical protein
MSRAHDPEAIGREWNDLQAVAGRNVISLCEQVAFLKESVYTLGRSRNRHRNAVLFFATIAAILLAADLCAAMVILFERWSAL